MLRESREIKASAKRVNVLAAASRIQEQQMPQPQIWSKRQKI